MDERLNPFAGVALGSQTMAQVGIVPLLLLLLLALLGSLFVGALYRYFFAPAATGSGLYLAFPLVGVSLTAIFLAIQFSLPLSLGLVAALTVIRFRTPVKEPEEIALLMVVIAIAVACAAFTLVFMAILLFAAVAALAIQTRIFSRASGDPPEALVVVRIPAGAIGGRLVAVRSVLEREGPGGWVDTLSRTDAGLELTYRFANHRNASVERLRSALDGPLAGLPIEVFVSRPGLLPG